MKYFTQRSTGRYSKFNCGIACAAMLIHHQVGRIIDVATTREFTRQLPTFLKTPHIKYLLHTFGIGSCTVPLNQEALMDTLDSGDKVILLVNMWLLPYSKTSVNKPYRTFHKWWNHYIVVDSYDTFSDTFTVLDPYTPNHSNGRLYDRSVLMVAAYKTSNEMTVSL
jgi:hypothetical protein